MQVSTAQATSEKLSNRPDTVEIFVIPNGRAEEIERGMLSPRLRRSGYCA
jgi:hypothetical protein